MREEMTRLIESQGGRAFVAPSVREVPLEENREALVFGERLMKGEIPVLILFTGVGTRTLIQVLGVRWPEQKIVQALSSIKLVARGPKPVKALSEVGLTPSLTIPEPNTWREILKTLDEKLPVDGLTVAVQEYGFSNRLFLEELKARGAAVMPVPVYRADFPIDTKPLEDLVERTLSGGLDVIFFTNALQVHHMMSLARKSGKAEALRRALGRTVVASVGPTCSEALQSLGLNVDFEPEHPKMGTLVVSAAKAARGLVERKRAAPVSVREIPRGVSRPGDALHESLFLKACRREPVTRTPIWLMRQAGRYMKEYRELRAKVPFLELCKNSDLAAEVTVDAAHRLGVDAAIIFADLLLIVEPLGFELEYTKGEGPVIHNPFQGKADLARLKTVVPEESLSFVLDAVAKTRGALKPDLPLIGFAGAPFTVASYLIEGEGSRQFHKTKALMHSDEKTWHAFLDKIAQATILYLNAQIQAGAQAVQLFDSWVGALSPEDYRTFVLPHSRRILQSLEPGVPVIHFATQSTGLLKLMKEAGGNVIGIDWRVELDEAWKILGEDSAVMGNLDPTALFSDPKTIRAQAERILNQAAGRPGHIFNLGHGVLPETPLENVLSLISSVKELSQRRP